MARPRIDNSCAKVTATLCDDNLIYIQQLQAKRKRQIAKGEIINEIITRERTKK